jgi:Flp pilus assembly pilin Flp/Flp pilus assembly protein TadG
LRVNNSRGQGLAEYIIICVVVAIVLILVVRFFGGSVSTKFQNATQEITQLREGDRDVPTAEGGPASGGPADPAPVSPGGGGKLAEGASPDSGERAGSARKGKGSADGGSDLSSLRPEAVGLKESAPLEDLAISWTTLGLLFGLACCGGVYYLLQMKKGKKQSSAKGAKPKKKLFTLGSRGKKESGQAIVEFLFIAITLLFTLLGVMQLALCLNAYAMVRYAAYNAARTAIVNGGDEEKMREAARISLLATFPKHGRADTRRGFMANYLGAKETDTLQALPPSMGNTDRITEVRIVDNNGLSTGETVTFDDPEEGQRAIVTVEVKHYYELVIPLVNRMVFYMYWRWNQGDYATRHLDNVLHEVDPMRRPGGEFYDIEYRVPIVAHYTMRLQSDYVVP